MPFVFGFDHSHPRPPRELRDLLGGKGANLAEMTSVLGLPVPPGFTISTEACRLIQAGQPVTGLDEELQAHLEGIEAVMGRRLGDEAHPLLVSVRSGAPISMPGMMDTVLDVGLNDRTVEALAAESEPRFAYDSYRRLVQQYGEVVLEVPGEVIEAPFEAAKQKAGTAVDASVPVELLREVVPQMLEVVASHTGSPFPQDPADQLQGAIDAVFRSWNSPRAVAYRRREGIPEDLGTAVNVQAMVFGNRDDRSATGVAFSRNPATGDPAPYGDLLVNAQGEDVVAGIRQTLPLAAMGDVFPRLHGELNDVLTRIERHYRDMCDVEFTIEQDKLWILQTRAGKRAGPAAVRIAVGLAEDPAIRLTPAEAVELVHTEHVEQLLHTTFRDHGHVIGKGLAASPGAATGRAYFSAEDAVEAADRGEEVILVRVETTPADVPAFAAATGVLTSRGGLVSHAAVVARGWGVPAVVGAADVEVGDHAFVAGGVTVSQGDEISIDGSTGQISLGRLEPVGSQPPPELATVLGWAAEVCGDEVEVRANADRGADAAEARRHGAVGIGLVRTEHQFLGRERLALVQRAILAETPEAEAAALAPLAERQEADFVELFEAMDGLPVTVRLLDAPLHEFLPSGSDAQDAGNTTDDSELASELFAAARAWQEHNPMMGTRGVRLGLLRPALYRAQVRAIASAAAERRRRGGEPIVEIMIPVVSSGEELRRACELVESELAAAREELGEDMFPEIAVGTMIETPRAALRAGDLARHAEFFSFGTNDLTQMTFGFSRDDVEARVIAPYVEAGILAADPFGSVDEDGVGELIRLGIQRGRAVNPELEVGVCGEHAADPSSVPTFVAAGVDYLSCSPSRVPAAWIAAAHAVAASAAHS